MIYRKFAILLIVILLSKNLFAQGFLRADGKRIVNDKGAVLLRGMGLGGWMLQEPYMLQLGGIASTQHEIKAKIEALIGKEKTATFYDAWLANHCTKADIDSLARWGFNSVRLPMHYNLFTLPVEQEPVPSKNTWLPKGFTMVDNLLSWCKADHIYLILDLHAAPGGEGHDNAIADRDTSKASLWDSEANRQKTVALWAQLAKRYANEQWIGAYDLLNETNWGFSNIKDNNGCAEQQNEPLKKLLKDVTTAIREVDKNHLVIVEGNCWGNNYSGVFPLWDRNMAVSFHKYWNYNDEKSIDKFIKIRDEQNVPVWCGESGENSNVWFTDAIRLLEDHQIGWAWWPLKKLGFNNPLQVKANDGYEKLIAYWKGQATKPSVDEAYKALMQLTENLKAQNCTWHKDVVDAMFRQVQSNATLSFKKNLVTNKTIIFAADYDLGRNGEAYFDNDTADFHVSTGKSISGNKGRVYRNDGVDIEPCTDATTNGFNVNSMQGGEWMQYTLTAPAAGVFKVSVRCKSALPGAGLYVTANGSSAKTVAVSNDTGWQTIDAGEVHLNKGVNKLRIFAASGELAINYLQFIAATKGAGAKK